MVRFDHRAVVCLAPIAQWIIFRALDDLLIDLIFLFRRKPFMWPRDAELAQAGEQRIAMLVPLWHEHRFIGEMLEHNLAAILYGNHDFFGWCVPNDALPLQAGDRIARSDARVHLALCRHDGPTSKGDCLNSTSNAMAGYEQRHGIEFKIVVIHEAEDLVHPQALQLINWFSQDIKWCRYLCCLSPPGWANGRTQCPATSLPSSSSKTVRAPGAGRVSALQSRGYRL